MKDIIIHLIIIGALIIFMIFKSTIYIKRDEIGLLKTKKGDKILKPGIRILPMFSIAKKLNIAPKTIEFNVNEVVDEKSRFKNNSYKAKIITKDKRSIKVNAKFSYEIFDSEKAVKNLFNIKFTVSQASQVFLVSIIRNVNYNEFVNSKDRYSNEVLNSLNKLCFEWGLKITNFEINEVSL